MVEKKRGEIKAGKWSTPNTLNLLETWMRYERFGTFREFKQKLTKLKPTKNPYHQMQDFKYWTANIYSYIQLAFETWIVFSQSWKMCFIEHEE